MKKNQKGFGAIELIIIVIVVALASSVAWYVGKHSSKTDSKTPTTTASINNTGQCSPVSHPGWQNYTNTTVGYCIGLPADWHFIKAAARQFNGQTDTDYQGNPVIYPAEILPKSEDTEGSSNGILEVNTDTSTFSPQQEFEKNGAGRANYVTGDGTASTINGYSAYTANLGGQAAAKNVTIGHNGKIVEFFYYTDGSMNKNVSICEQIINTIKFTN
jgi:hypothetical protein